MTDFQSQFDRQIRFLNRSCLEFDEKMHFDEAVRIATVIRTLIHQTGRSTSLLTHLGATKINILSTVGSELLGDETMMSQGMCLTTIDVEKGVFINAQLDQGPPITQTLKLDDWWAQKIWIYQPYSYTRKQLILDMTNKDGGAHVDATTPNEYIEISGASGGFPIQVNNSRTGQEKFYTYEQAHFCTVRQIAWELQNSPDFVALSL